MKIGNKTTLFIVDISMNIPVSFNDNWKLCSKMHDKSHFKWLRQIRYIGYDSEIAIYSIGNTYMISKAISDYL